MKTYRKKLYRWFIHEHIYEYEWMNDLYICEFTNHEISENLNF